MARLGLYPSLYELCVYVHDKRLLIVSVVVDDFSVYSLEDIYIDWFFALLSKVFDITEELDKTYVSMQIDCTDTFT